MADLVPGSGSYRFLVVFDEGPVGVCRLEEVAREAGDFAEEGAGALPYSDEVPEGR